MRSDLFQSGCNLRRGHESGVIAIISTINTPLWVAVAGIQRSGRISGRILIQSLLFSVKPKLNKTISMNDN
jgi:hypothetical protein